MSLTAQAVKNAQLISLIQIYGHRWIWNIQIPSMRRKALWQNPLNGSKDDCSGIVNFIILLERAELHKATSKLGKYKKAVELLQQMPQAGLSPKTFTFVLVLNACANLQAAEEGRDIHKQNHQKHLGIRGSVTCSLITKKYEKSWTSKDA